MASVTHHLNQICCGFRSGTEAQIIGSRLATQHGFQFRMKLPITERFANILLKNSVNHVSSVRCSGIGGSGGDKQTQRENSALDEYTLEAELQAAINLENYAEAARLRDEIRAIHEDSRAGVLAANTKFYRAFELGDMEMMRSIWAPGENVHCIHPGAGRISGYDMVMASWELMLGPETALPLKIELHNMEIEVKGCLAYVTCLEVVRTTGSSWGKQLATNIFNKQNGTWYICMHHASHITL